MIYRVPVFYSDGGKAAASPESMVSYARHVVGNCDGAKPTAIKECFKY